MLQKSLRSLTIWFALAFITLIALGSWQVYRLVWKQQVIAQIDAKLALDPVTLADDQVLNLDDWVYRRVIIRGRFLHDKEVHLYTGPKQMYGDLGYNIITPMQLDDGRIVVVDRGWVPHTKKNQEDRLETLVAGGDIEYVGMIHKTEQPAWFTPDNNTTDNIWFWIDTSSVLGDLAMGQTGDYFIRVLKNPDIPFVWPLAGENKVEVRNHHLQYAITWVLLALILIIIYVALSKQILAKQPVT